MYAMNKKMEITAQKYQTKKQMKLLELKCNLYNKESIGWA